ncbi:LysR family transcriptional regulator [Eleftheria terrae]|uniref:LysR family transcriptional regulator n=1 Tax=Eleftheria terrae TaxID=1597781 RepID=UPI00263A5FEA|nr:LysR family transcriptional regulator [Eleftheria terrae]WKB55020.1 LysR family transcriptional regulator [Eleftheria terrae]
MDRLKQMETFLAVTEEGSFSGAAQREHVSATIIARRINELEQRLGVKLVHRSTRHLRLTEQGVLFAEECKRLLQDLELAEHSIQDVSQQATGHLAVSAPAAFGRKHVAAHASSFLAEHPGVSLSFNLTDRVVDLVREGYHLGIRIGGAVDPNMVAVKLAPNQRVVCASPRYLQRHGRPQTLDDLARHQCLAFNLQGGQQRGWFFHKDGRDVTVRVRGHLDCNDGELLHRWCVEGLGLSWRSTWEIQRELAEGSLVTVLDEYASPDYDITAIFPQQRYQPAKIRLFIAHLKAAYAMPDYWMRPVALRSA